jgi:site-specific recombinase XerD
MGPRIRLHEVRHTHATLLLMMGENIRLVSEGAEHLRLEDAELHEAVEQPQLV